MPLLTPVSSPHQAQGAHPAEQYQSDALVDAATYRTGDLPARQKVCTPGWPDPGIWWGWPTGEQPLPEAAKLSNFWERTRTTHIHATLA